MDMLARREHSFHELVAKLSRKFIEKIDRTDSSCEEDDSHRLEALISQQLEILARENLQSDDRFVEAFVNGRKSQGKGPLRIRYELQQKGLSDTLVAAYVDDSDPQWLMLARQVCEKKFGAEVSHNYQEKARRLRFMQYRGFPHSVIKTVVE